ncbi:hypothetical protein PanWU01x14_112080 [Parasponia andersonii]|uniref:Uncharacterized protein n=1 Tax=Parasponia andersonii TaxID=3476 RepID=A0A2P5CY69_PARAD|nr:hypothetical protein PanWU01x14_112080 [Parasponia andersonii]
MKQMNRTANGIKLEKERVIGSGGIGVVEWNSLEVNVFDLRVLRKEGGDAGGFSCGDGGFGGDQGDRTVVRQKHGSNSKKGCQVSHSGARKESYVRRQNVGIIDV